MRISKAAYDLIVKEEVSSRGLYEKRYRGAIWPGEQSGVTIGIGCDVGYTTPAKLRRDWKGRIPDRMIEALVPCCGVKGPSAKPLASRLKAAIDIPFDVAIKHFNEVKLPEFEDKTIKAFPGAEDLPPDCLGALVSLVFNRGELINRKDRRIEMFNIRTHIRAGDLDLVPDEFRDMQRHWNSKSGLRPRREREAVLFEKGLRSRINRFAETDPSEELPEKGDFETGDFNAEPPHGEESDEFLSIQQRLQARGYAKEIGIANGKWGGGTAGAISAFKNDRRVVGPALVDDQLRTELADAEVNNWSRPIAPERAAATESEIKAVRPTLAAAIRGRLAALWGLIVAGFSALVANIGETFSDVWEAMAPLRRLFSAIPISVWISVAGLFFFLMYLNNRRAAKLEVEAFKKAEVP